MKSIEELRGRKAKSFKPGDVKHTASFYEETTPVDPSHYRSEKGFQAIDVIEEATKDAPTGFSGMLQGNSIKYLYRLWRKENALQDAKKARWYLDKLIEELEK